MWYCLIAVDVHSSSHSSVNFLIIVISTIITFISLFNFVSLAPLKFLLLTTLIVSVVVVAVVASIIILAVYYCSNYIYYKFIIITVTRLKLLHP